MPSRAMYEEDIHGKDVGITGLATTIVVSSITLLYRLSLLLFHHLER
jgi:hypothetical protein